MFPQQEVVDTEAARCYMQLFFRATEGWSMSDLLKAAERRLQELDRRLRSMPAFREMEATRRYVEEMRALTSQALDPTPGPSVASSPDERPAAARNARNLTWAEIAIRVLLEVGRPVNSRRLVAEMAKRGHHVGGAKPEINLASMLSKATSVRSVQWGGRRRWWLVDQELPLEPEGDGEENSAGEWPTIAPPADLLQTVEEARMEPP